MAKKARILPSAEDESRWQQLKKQLKQEWAVLRPSRYRTGKILYELKTLIKKYRWDKGRKGRWRPLLTELRMPESTANEAVRDYEEQEQLSQSERFFKPTKSHKNRQKTSQNTADSAAFVASAPDKLKDKSMPSRIAVECTFILTMEQKKKFMRCVQTLGEEQATQTMYEAVVSRDSE